MGGDDYDSLDPDDCGARSRADGPASAAPAVLDVASEPSAGQRIPAELWQAAIAVARVHGSNPTVAALKLNYYDLQRRLAGGTARQDGCAPAPVFVELPAGSMCSGAGERGGVELVPAGGARLIVHRGSVGSDELLAVVELFLRHGR